MGHALPTIPAAAFPRRGSSHHHGVRSMRKSLAALSALALVGLIVTFAGGDAPKNEADDNAVRKAIADYTTALTKGDLKAISDYWTADAEFVDEAGTVHKGRTAIINLFAKGLVNAKNAKHSISVKSLRFPAPGVALTEVMVESTIDG